jgi:hypothetical protein
MNKNNNRDNSEFKDNSLHRIFVTGEQKSSPKSLTTHTLSRYLQD